MKINCIRKRIVPVSALVLAAVSFEGSSQAQTATPTPSPVPAPQTRQVIQGTAARGTPVTKTVPLNAPLSQKVPHPVQPLPKAITNGEEAVDLSNEFAPPAAKPLPAAASTNRAAPAPAPGAPAGAPPPGAKRNANPFLPGGPSNIQLGPAQNPINLKVYFDLNLYSRPGVKNLAFDNFHSFLFLDASPIPELSFAFDVSPNPRFFEMDYQLTPSIQIRGGKIWIPFDDTTPHNIYGGRVNVSKLLVQGEVPFLPDLWTDLGVGVKWIIRDVKDLNLVADAYVVNGFTSGGQDPTGGTKNYPSFADLTTTADNNDDKSVGGRLHGLFWNRLGLGVSVYSGRWSNQDQPNERVLMYGADLQYRIPPGTEFRFGLASMKVNLETEPFYRAGSYAEIGQYLTKDRLWKLLVRAGTLQEDDRVIDNNDKRLVGFTLIRRVGLIQLSLEHSNDIQKVAGKPNYSFTNLRAVIAF